MINWRVVSLGGSLICPQNIDIDFLKRFRETILKRVRKGEAFIIFTGGGKIAREYQRAAKELGISKTKTLDLLGIWATRMNAILLQTIFGRMCDKDLIFSLQGRFNPKKKIVIGAGYEPGHSTDYDAVYFANRIRTNLVINLSNIDFVYDKDPKKFKDARKIEKISINDFLKIVGRKWRPGGNFPFDPRAALLARSCNIKIIILNGRNLENLERFLDGGKFMGTEIFP